MQVALFIGRFQPLHLGHLSVIKGLVSRYTLVKLGIGSSQCRDTLRNPLSGEERKLMIEAVLKEENITNYKTYLIPDIHNDELWVDHVNKIVGKYDFLYSGNKSVIRLFNAKEIPTSTIKELKPYSSTQIRKKISANRDISRYVHPKVIESLKKFKIYGRMKNVRSS